MPISKKNILFCLPIYIDSESEYYDFLKNNRDISVEHQVQQFKKIGFDPNGIMEQDLRRKPNTIHPEQIAWRYNRIIGWVEFYADGGIIKADLWFIRAKRISKRVKNVIIDYRGKISDIVDTYHLNNKQIGAEIEKFLVDLQKGKYGRNYLQRRHIDKSLFLKNLKYINIKMMIEDLVRT